MRIQKLIMLGIIYFIMASGQIRAQNEFKNSVKNQFFIENQFLLANSKLQFFPIFNSEFCFGYGLTDWLVLGVFDDLYLYRSQNNSNKIEYVHYPGLKTSVSMNSIINRIVNKKQQRMDLQLSGFFSYSNGNSLAFEKKDSQQLVNFYKINGMYYLTSHLFISASIGVINSNEVHIGLGIKL